MIKHSYHCERYERNSCYTNMTYRDSSVDYAESYSSSKHYKFKDMDSPRNKLSKHRRDDNESYSRHRSRSKGREIRYNTPEENIYDTKSTSHIRPSANSKYIKPQRARSKKSRSREFEIVRSSNYENKDYYQESSKRRCLEDLDKEYCKSDTYSKSSSRLSSHAEKIFSPDHCKLEPSYNEYAQKYEHSSLPPMIILKTTNISCESNKENLEEKYSTGERLHTKKSLLGDGPLECRIPLSQLKWNLEPEKRVTSLLGDGPKELRLCPAKPKKKNLIYRKPVQALKMVHEHFESKSKYFDSPMSLVNLDDAPVKNEGNYSDQTVAIFDYNHEKVDINKLELVNPIVKGKNIENYNFDKEFDHDNVKLNYLAHISISDYMPQCVTRVVDYSHQLKTLAEIISPPKVECIENARDIKLECFQQNRIWKLVKLDIPVRVGLTQENIDINTCSENDPRTQHLRKLSNKKP